MRKLVFKRFSCSAKLMLLAGAGIALIAILMSKPLTASAAIKCEGQFQIIKGHGRLSTPYCEDYYLATIARSYGWKVSNRAIRQNPNLKARVCRHIGHDARLRIICSAHTYDRGRGRFWR